MASSSDIFSRLQSQMFRRGSSSDESEPDRQPPRVDPATSRVKRCLFGRGNTEENIKFAKRELEKSLLESKKKWNFDFEHERPLEGRFEWQTSPYPKLLKAKSSTSSVASENVENLQPDSSSRKDLEDKSLSTQHLQHTSTSSSDERICDQPRLPEVAQGAKESSSSSASSASSLNQRSARQSAINRKQDLNHFQPLMLNTQCEFINFRDISSEEEVQIKSQDARKKARGCRVLKLKLRSRAGQCSLGSWRNDISPRSVRLENRICFSTERGRERDKTKHN